MTKHYSKASKQTYSQHYGIYKKFLFFVGS